MKISIITPVYNGVKFISECLDNIIEQSCQDIEHIIVDGGSTDGSVGIIQEYAEFYKHIRWISEKDNGQSDAMNKGINLAKGKFISFLNVDDYYEPGALNRVLEVLDDLEEPTFLVGNCRILSDDGKIKYINKPNDLRVTKLLLQQTPFPLNPSAYFYHKSLHYKIGFYDVNEHYMMDLDFIIKAVQCSNIKYVDVILGNHRQIDGTKTINLMQSGHHQSHLNELFRKHIRNLSLLKRIQICLELIKQSSSYYMSYIFNNPVRFFKKIFQKIVIF